MKVKLTFLFQQHEETEDINHYTNFLETKVIPRILEIEGVSHVELCQYVPFSFVEMQKDEEPKHLLQMDLYYDEDAGIEKAMSNFNDAYLVEEIINATEYLDLYISHISKYSK